MPALTGHGHPGPFQKNAKMALFNPCMKLKKKFGQKTSFEALRKCHLQNPGFRSVKVQIDTFFKKDSRDFKNSFYLGFL